MSEQVENATTAQPLEHAETAPDAIGDSEPRTVKPGLKMPDRKASFFDYEGPKEINIFEMYDSPPSIVFRSPISPRSESGFSRTIMDSAVLSEDEIPRDVRQLLTRYSVGCYNPITEENTITEPFDPSEWKETGRVSVGLAPSNIECALLDRPTEMAELLEFNKHLDNEVKFRLGPDKYEEAINLWCRTTRGQMNDKKWIKKSYNLLVKGLGGDKGPWTRWRLMIGYDPLDFSLLEEEEEEEEDKVEEDKK